MFCDDRTQIMNHPLAGKYLQIEFTIWCCQLAGVWNCATKQDSIIITPHHHLHHNPNYPDTRHSYIGRLRLAVLEHHQLSAIVCIISYIFISAKVCSRGETLQIVCMTWYHNTYYRPLSDLLIYYLAHSQTTFIPVFAFLSQQHMH